MFGEEEVAVIYPAGVRAASPMATMEIRALHSYQPIGLEGPWDEQVEVEGASGRYPDGERQQASEGLVLSLCNTVGGL